ncbi:hypothetical protein BDN70DRAFT_412737 [Pholiota conissans]|uniref:Uncharacterized protein n=1 Tax=Pholiota conissans TaxID=109636 RepID=A0A9P5YSE9_9AGAR|nr:hypothetical protein BDN70DRAFT_412737 [Pholiota conissans]
MVIRNQRDRDGPNRGRRSADESSRRVRVDKQQRQRCPNIYSSLSLRQSQCRSSHFPPLFSKRRVIKTTLGCRSRKSSRQLSRGSYFITILVHWFVFRSSRVVCQPTPLCSIRNARASSSASPHHSSMTLIDIIQHLSLDMG